MSFRRPRTPAHAILLRLAEWLEVGHSLSPVWPRGETRHGDCRRCLRAHDYRRLQAAETWESPLLFHSHPRDCFVLRVSHVVDWTLGSHACRIGGGGAWILTSAQVGAIFLSRRVLACLGVGLGARTGIPCPCCRQVSRLQSGIVYFTQGHGVIWP